MLSILSVGLTRVWVCGQARLVGEVKAGSLLAVGEPYAISFDPAWLTDLA
jgi:hypothetical protein